LRERVAGSTLFERLRRDAGPCVKVFFFGGPDGVARTASDRLNAEPSPLRCVGFDSPGFGSVEDMSGADRLARINESGADFVVVSLGAKKGQAWIVHNLHALRAPVVSHLGAVVNFVAGTVRRSPDWMGRSGLEWLWRIREERALWRRYAGDGLAFLRLLLTHVLPRWVRLRLNAPTLDERNAASVELREEGATLTLALKSAWCGNDKATLRAALSSSANDARPLRLDLSAATHLDSASIGLLSVLWAHRRKKGLGWQVTATHPGARRDLAQSCAEYLLQEHRSTARQKTEAAAC
jgi:N-acetylglucosaminyldiphosphoundecaprenol N-acetyl-beta-D-mannosaminyltransferase